MDSVEKSQSLKTVEPLASRKESNAKNGVEDLRKRSIFFRYDVSFGSEFDSDVIGLSDQMADKQSDISQGGKE